jgi:hypothetical protein
VAYLPCGRCGLDIKIQAAFLQLENCPRCLARSASVVPLTLSPRRVSPPAAGARPVTGASTVSRAATATGDSDDRHS